MRQVSSGHLARTLAWLLLAMSCLMSLFLIHSPGTSDVSGYWLRWMRHIDGLGPVAAYVTAETDYPPGSFLILYLAHLLGDAAGCETLTALKTTIFVFQLLSTGLVLVMSGSPMLAAAFNASVMLNGIGLGYLDLFFAPPLLAAFWALRCGRPVLGTLLFGISCLTKWQPLLVAPYFAIHLFGITSLRPRDWLALLHTPLFRRIAVLTAAVVLLLFAGFGLEPLIALRRASQNGFFSAYAMNLAWIEQFFYRVLIEGSTGLADPATYMLHVDLWVTRLHKGLFYLTYAATLLWAVRSAGLEDGPPDQRLGTLILFAITGFLSYVMLSTGVHENHLFLPLVLGFLLAALAPSPVSWTIAALMAAMANANLLLFYGLTGEPAQSRVVGMDLSIPLSVVFLAIWLTFLLWAARLSSEVRPAAPRMPERSLPSSLLLSGTPQHVAPSSAR